MGNFSFYFIELLSNAASGNDASLKKQSNNSVYLFDKKAPKAPTGLYTITGNEIITLSWKTSDEKDINKYFLSVLIFIISF